MDDHSMKEFWNHLWRGRKPAKYEGPAMEGHPLLQRFLPIAPQLKFLEIGCVPGNWMVYFHKEYGYQVSGIDYSEAISLAQATCALNRVQATIWHDDVFTAKFPEPFDVVFSAGFVEHFDPWQEVIDVHLRWLKPGGYLVVSIPNIRGIHKFPLKVFHPAYYATFRLKIFKELQIFREYLARPCQILYFGYWITWRPFYSLPLPLDLIARGLRRFLRNAGLQNIPNPYFSPYLWVVARKR
jgi:SAM-dependent methyltransferase